MRTNPPSILTVVLVVAAAVALAYGVLRDEVATGMVACAVLFIAKAYRDLQLSRGTALEPELISRHAPELADKAAADAEAHVRAALEAFRRRASAAAQAAFRAQLAQEQDAWQTRGEVMPAWATLSLLRRAEAADHVRQAPEHTAAHAPLPRRSELKPG